MAEQFWSKFVHRDHVSKTYALTKVQRCGYYDLYNACFINGGYVPDDDAELARATMSTLEEWAEIRPVLARFFTVNKRGWSHKDLLAEMAKTSSKVEAKRESGRLGGIAKARKDKANQASECYGENHVSPCKTQLQSESQIKKDKKEEESVLLERGRARDTADHDIPDSTFDGLNGEEGKSIDLKEEAPPVVPARQTSMQRQVQELQAEYMAKFRAEYGPKPQKQYTAAELGVEKKAEFMATLSEQKPTAAEPPTNGQRYTPDEVLDMADEEIPY